jgi:type VI protein secretion system component VasF
VLGTVARDSARALVELRRQRKAAKERPDSPERPRRRRFKRRWVVVPTLVVILVGVLVTVGALWLLALLFGMG